MSELKRMGIPESFLRTAFIKSAGDGKFAWKANLEKKNSPIVFDTEGLEKYRLKQIELEKKSRPKQGVI